MKRPGRPRVDPDDESVQVCVTVTQRTYDRACVEAQRHGVSIPEVLRRQLARRGDREDED
jgi:hypothetical protein